MTNILTFKNITMGAMLLAAVAVIGVYASQMGAPAVQEIHLQYPADFSDNRILMGASHNVFVGRVIKQSGEVLSSKLPSTQFEVEVIENIKGDLQGSVTVDQLGGYKDGTLYIVDEDTLLPGDVEGDGLLQPGSVYLLATRYDEKDGQYVLMMHPNGIKRLSDNMSDNASLTAIIETDEKVQAFKEAYKNEVLLDADIRNNNTRNSYQTIQ